MSRPTGVIPFLFRPRRRRKTVNIGTGWARIRLDGRESRRQSRRDVPKPAQGGADASGASEAQPWVGRQTQRQKPEGLALIGRRNHAATGWPGSEAHSPAAWLALGPPRLGLCADGAFSPGVARRHVPHAAPPRAVIGLCLRHGRGHCWPRWNKPEHARKDQFPGKWHKLNTQARTLCFGPIQWPKCVWRNSAGERTGNVDRGECPVSRVTRQSACA